MSVSWGGGTTCAARFLLLIACGRMSSISSVAGRDELAARKKGNDMSERDAVNLPNRREFLQASIAVTGSMIVPGAASLAQSGAARATVPMRSRRPGIQF
jgi:hypothetical protein